MNLKMSEDDLFWSSLSDGGEECEYAIYQEILF